MEKLDILVVEDKKIHQDSANDLLGEHNIVAASNLVEALAHLGQDYVGNRTGSGFIERAESNRIKEIAQESAGKSYDIVLTDMMFPLGPGIINLTREGEYQRHEEQPLGYAMALYAAKQGIPLIGILTDMNHHAGPIAATFDLFRNRDSEHGREEFTINDSKVALFDNRDFPEMYLMKDGSLTEQASWRLSDGESALYQREAGAEVTVKNWKGVLGALRGD